MYILAIESSCDETSAAVIGNTGVLSNIIATQEIHAAFGGVVPELASRAHQQQIVPVVHQALQKAGISKKELSAVAFTSGPGLMGALLVGSSFAKGLALGLNIPLIAADHMRAHILAHFIEAPVPAFPFLCLTVSGGHTQIVRIDSPMQMTILGQTQDDAAGEAFDKTAKLLGLPYPGGPLIDKYAAEGNPHAFPFPIVEMPGLNFSFSGVKTAFMYFFRSKSPEFLEENRNDICASVQYTLVEILMRKLRKAATETGIKDIAIAGGVSANSGLRKALAAEAEKSGWNTFIPRFEYCTDNAAMIAQTAWFKYQAGEFSTQDAAPNPSLAF
ncbi:MAG: tRNA (adenosine(37)-N6)-threonylcarbamoyltransferase complex transferase subunit TsaD [Bacteroidota bacterium]